MDGIEAAARTLNKLTGEWDWDRQLSHDGKEHFKEIARETLESFQTGEPCPDGARLEIHMRW